MSWRSFTPIGTKVLVRLDGRRDKIGSIHVPACFARQPESGVVVARGPRAPSELQPGTRVLLGKYNGVLVESPLHDVDSEYYICESDHSRPVPHTPDIYATIEAAADDDVTELVSSDVPKRRAGG